MPPVEAAKVLARPRMGPSRGLPFRLCAPASLTLWLCALPAPCPSWERRGVRLLAQSALMGLGPLASNPCADGSHPWIRNVHRLRN